MGCAVLIKAFTGNRPLSREGDVAARALGGTDREVVLPSQVDAAVERSKGDTWRPSLGDVGLTTHHLILNPDHSGHVLGGDPHRSGSGPHAGVPRPAYRRSGGVERPAFDRLDTASFTYLAMERYWHFMPRKHHGKRRKSAGPSRAACPRESAARYPENQAGVWMAHQRLLWHHLSGRATVASILMRIA
jgi:hypothetical protein